MFTVTNSDKNTAPQGADRAAAPIVNLPLPHPDRSVIDRFVRAMFKHADATSFVSLRGFPQTEGPAIHIEAVGADDMGALLERAVYGAGIVAVAGGVFAPPICTFRSPTGGGGDNVADGLVLSVDIDSGDSGAKRAALEAVLGAATMVVASGGEWPDPATGTIHDKLHLHWRLAAPTRTAADHARLNDARKWAALLVGADKSAPPIVHPFRWPGTLHLKGEPRFARIVAETDAEIGLDAAIAALQVAGAAAGMTFHATPERLQVVRAYVESDQPHNVAQAIQVARSAEPAMTGTWHDCGYRLGCELARIGLSPEKAVEVLATHWVPRGSGFKSEAQFERDVLGGYHDAVRDGGHGVHAVLAADQVFDGVRADQPDDPWQSGGPSGFNGSRIVALTAQECATVPTPPYIVKGLLARGQVAAIAALPGSGKSCFTPLLAYRMSQGKMVFGRRTKPGRVAYFGLEDEHGMAGRITALSMKHGEAAEFRLFLRARNLLTCADEREEVKRMVRAGRPDLVVFDTVRAGWRGLSENDSDAMSNVLAFVRELTQGVDGVPGPAVILIHHTTKSGGHTMAGSGVLEADADVTMFLEKDPETNVVTVSFGKNRNGESTGNEMFFSIEPVRIKMDADGDPETRPVAVEVDPKTVRRDRKLSPTQAKAIAILEELAGSAGANVPKTPDMIFAGVPFGEAICVLRDEWQTACELRGLSTAANPADRSRVFRKALQELVALKRIVQLGDHIYLMKGAAE